ncbi:hypothetical protein KZP23_14495 [Echinicola marina]|uniref:hypothetical protein n=1 Tax=Echinicola marina TaxID=2859768 RepID=UPI001CF6CE9C|nr:hypothetical protein [Echinicola marina]UCS91932.1 hypothetical protein KZP23_14495 [Echinicola marina]
MKSFCQISIFLYCLAISYSACSQVNDTIPPALVAVYLGLIPEPQEVYSGGQYAVGKAFHIEGTSYLESADFEKGSITINGLNYENILLNYDIQDDQLVTFHPRNYQRIIINAQRVNSFTLANGRCFIRTNENKEYFLHRRGYYEVLLKGDIAVLAKHIKVEELKKDQNSKETKRYFFIHTTHFFIRQKDRFYRINKKKDLALVLDIPKKQLNQSLKEQQLKFKKQTAESLVTIVKAYLTNESKD